jgi:hypothetical protein
MHQSTPAASAEAGPCQVGGVQVVGMTQGVVSRESLVIGGVGHGGFQQELLLPLLVEFRDDIRGFQVVDVE